MLKVCLTFDYELFFGNNYGTEKEILFDPTAKLMTVLREENVSATFFVDVCSLTRYQQLGMDSYVQDMRMQLLELSKEGQDLQLHLHPHWLTSTYTDGKWNFDEQTYRLHAFGFERSKSNSVEKIIEEGISWLNNTIVESDPQYRCIAYRAGGFALQPHEQVVEALYNAGIRIDSSVAPQIEANGTTNYYNYVQSGLQSNWWIASETAWWEDNPSSSKRLYEVPIATENKNPIRFAIQRLLTPDKIRLKQDAKKGTYINENHGSKNTFSAYWRYLSGYTAMSVDAYKSEFLYKQLLRYYKKHDCKNQNAVIALIGHPKLITDAYIENLRTLIRRMKADGRMEICSIKDVYNNIISEK